MITLALLLLSQSYCIDVPQFGMLFVNSYFSSEEEAQQSLNQLKNNINLICDNLGEIMSHDLCVKVYSSLQEIHCSDGSDLNQKLSTFSSSNKMLFINGKNIKQEIDFNNLKSQMVVQLLYSSSDDIKSLEDNEEFNKFSHKMAKSSFPIQFNKAIFDCMRNIENTLFGMNKKNHIKQHNKNIKKEYVNLPEVSIVGNIKDKVSYLTILGSKVKITKNDLNCHTLSLSLYSRISENSLKIKTTNFIVEGTAYWNNDDIIEGSSDLIQSNLFGIAYYQYDEDEVEGTAYRISYNDDYWSVESKAPGSEEFGDLDNDLAIHVPYTRCSMFNFIAYSFNFDIHLSDDTNIDSFKAINITAKPKATDFSSIFGAKKLDKKELKITRSGNWENVEDEKMPEVAVSYNKDETSFVEDKSLNFKFKDNEDSVDDGGSGGSSGSGGSTGKSNGQKLGIIIGVVVGVIVVVAIIVVVVIVVIRKKKSKQQSESEGEGADAEQK